MSQVQPITIEEQDAFLTTGKVPTKLDTRIPRKYRQAEKLNRAQIDRTLAQFGKPENLPNFKFTIGSTVYTTNGTTAWTVVAQAETPAGTSPRSYRCVAGKMERIFGEYALRIIEPTAAPKPLTIIDVRLNKDTGQIEPIDPAVKNARDTLKSQLEATVAKDQAPNVPLITDPALHTVEPMTSRFTSVTTWKQVDQPATAKPVSATKAPAPRLNSPFAADAIVTLLVDTNPKKPGTATYGRFGLYRSGKTVAATIEAGVTMADVKWDTAHKFIKVTHA